MSDPRILTIGVYGFEEEGFFECLVEARVDLFCDVRARRGVRGARYAFANSQRLQERLETLGIRYVHRPDLAPSDATRKAQYEVDVKKGQGKRSRDELSPAFVQSYEKERLVEFDARRFVDEVAKDAEAMVLFCVEGTPRACHRSLVADRIQAELGSAVQHLVPRASSSP